LPDHDDTPQVSQIVTFPAQAASRTALPGISLSVTHHRIRGRAWFFRNSYCLNGARAVRQVDAASAGTAKASSWRSPGNYLREVNTGSALEPVRRTSAIARPVIITGAEVMDKVFAIVLRAVEVLRESARMLIAVPIC
jgi:hypothetical protein